MTQEVFEIVKGMDLKNIETQLALQCAPLITGLKMANLLIIPGSNEKLVRRILGKTGISCYRLIKNREKMTFLLFKRGQLENYLITPKVQEVLRSEGYTTDTLGGILRVFQARYQLYKDGKGMFPHEMGLLLGYPVEDVTGFIKNEGKNFLYSGYWKVYENIHEKIDLFRSFQQAKETLIQLLAGGCTMEVIIERYKEKELQSIGLNC